MSPYAGKTVLPRRFGTHPGLRREGPPPETRRRRPRQSREVGPSQWNTRPRRDVRLRPPAGGDRDAGHPPSRRRRARPCDEADRLPDGDADRAEIPLSPEHEDYAQVAPGEAAAMDLAEQFRGCFRVENEFSGRPGRVEALRPFSGVAGCMDTPCDSSSASVPE